MAAPANLITIAIAAGIGLGMALYYLITYLTEEKPLRDRLTLPSNSSKSLSYSPPPKRSSRTSKCEVLSPVFSTPQRVTSTSNSGARRRETGPVRNCYICTNPLGTDTLSLGCGHTFDKECYHIVEQMWRMFNVSSKCPQCITESR